MKKIIYISSSILLIIILLSTYFIIFSKPKGLVKYLEPVKMHQKTLDERFFILFGKVTKVNADSIDVSPTKGESNTDHIFNDISSINVITNKNLMVKKFDIKKQAYTSLNMSDVKTGGFVGVFIDKDINNGYKAIGVELFDKSIVK